MSKRLIARSKLSNRQLRQLIDFFALEVPALKAARVIGIHRHSAERVYQVIRQHRDLSRPSFFVDAVFDEDYLKRRATCGGIVPVTIGKGLKIPRLRRNGAGWT